VIPLAWLSGIAPRLIAGAVVAAAVLAGYRWIDHRGLARGRAEVQTAWDVDVARRAAAALAAEQSARATEQALNDKVRKVSNAYAIEKTRRATADRAAADSLRRLGAALAGDDRAPGADPAATGRADDDPRDGIIAECADALGRVDSAYRALASQTEALQGYTREVCLRAENISDER